MSSKKYVICLLILFGLVYSVLYWLFTNKIYYSNIEYPMWVYNHEYMYGKDHKYEILIIGDSKAKAGIEVNMFKMQTLNMSLGGATPIVGYYTLVNYLKKNKKPESIILSYSPMHLMIQDTFWERSVYFNYLNFTEIISILIVKSKINGNTFLLWEDIKKIIEYKFNIFNEFKYFKYFFDKQKYRENKDIYNALIKNNGHSYFGKKEGTHELINEIKIKEFKSDKLINYYLEKIISLSKEYNIKVYFTSLPYNESSYKRLNIDYINRFEEYIKLKDLIYVNNIFSMEDEMFGDPAHLYLGSEKFTKYLLKEMNK